MPGKQNRIKADGVHYTPPELADFLAGLIRTSTRFRRGPIRVLDPACGTGALLTSLVDSFPRQSHSRLNLTGYETDSCALSRARQSPEFHSVNRIRLIAKDFLSADGHYGRLTDHSANRPDQAGYDIVIANPPYVRTQVLGARRARSLANRFGLSGRIDLSHAFVVAMTMALREGGTLGLLTSNRFLTTRAGESLRRFLRRELELVAIHDLGDTRLFSAAVLPLILIARRRSRNAARTQSQTGFSRVYRCQDHCSGVRFDDVLQAVRDENVDGIIETTQGLFHLQRGILAEEQKPGDIWSLATPESEAWLSAIRQSQVCTIADVAEVRVGIKTTADAVFVRDDWDLLPPEQQPEACLLHPLITHHEASRWSAACRPKKNVLYPHLQSGSKRIPIDLDHFPGAAAYFAANRKQLAKRRYVTESGRKWFEIWVPHRPEDWKRRKIVFPDISDIPRFFFDAGTGIVQGDCYWMVTRDSVPNDWLHVILAVCNSTLAVRFYDTAFCNRLYSGRRRFMTQYVRQFPLPALNAPATQKLVSATKRLLADGVTENAERRLNQLVWEAFGLEEPD